MVRKFDKNLFHLSRADAVARVTPTIDVVTNQPSDYTRSASEDLAWVRWGEEDSIAIEMLRMCWDSPTKPRLMDQAKEFMLGAGPKLVAVDIDADGKEVRRLVRNPELKKWFRRKQIYSRYLELAALSLAFSEIAFVRFSILDSGEVALETIQPNKVRFQKPEPGQPLTHVLVNPYFGTDRNVTKKDITRLPIFDPEEPDRYLESIMVLRKAQIGADFYTQGLWWGTKTWTRVDNLIPEYHLSGLVNGYNIKLLIEIDESYFIMEDESIDDEETMAKVEERKEAFMERLDDYLAGVKNTDKALVMIGNLADASGKEKKLIRIQPIENKMTDDAYMSLMQQAGMKQAQGHGVLPSLAGIAEGDKLGGSGSELMHSVMYQVRYMTGSYRRLLMEPLNYALEVMGHDLDQMEYFITDIEMTTLDKNPTGQQKAMTNT